VALPGGAFCGPLFALDGPCFYFASTADAETSNRKTPTSATSAASAASAASATSAASGAASAAPTAAPSAATGELYAGMVCSGVFLIEEIESP
jgi:hypothetical protein